MVGRQRALKIYYCPFWGQKCPIFRGELLVSGRLVFFESLKLAVGWDFSSETIKKKTPGGQWVGEHLNVKVLHVNSDYHPVN